MIKKYDKDSDYSYTTGFFPTFELIKYQKEHLINIYVSEDVINSDGYKKLKTLVSPEKIIISDKTVSKLSPKENAHVIGIFKKYESKLSKDFDHLVLVNPSEQGNLGNAMRTLLAFNLHDLAVIKPAADIFNPKTIRSSMGAFFHIRIETFSSFDEYLERYKREYYPFILSKAKRLSEVKFKTPCALVFGNEATGLPIQISNQNSVRIEQSDEVDSLNLTTSIAVALYELYKQKGF